ncbi:triose-phosphate isomerase [Aminipila luticellarii]|uniref:Triosephosphate isomerase n=1 Tax=Aminipila luticellarii TaxID=2507160 RepID=A0A410PZ11_9FIRM|nr:triose-phosphate isomerase [Aminipila luticellarii]QAT44124.1 triose-phosphate isomerase [Aminipila luticellarii]
MRKPLIAGNWKMFKTTEEAKAFAASFKKIYESSDIQVAICAPFTQLGALKEAFKGTDIKVGAQNMHFAEEGAFTGEISAAMLQEIGVDYCIIGHSERRQLFAETDETVNKKLHKAFLAGITPILCVGESLEERDADRAFDVVKSQLVKGLEEITAAQAEVLVIAYEPIWAIGTGRTASPEQANEMCGFIRDVIDGLYGEIVADKTIIQYGGSVKPSNATEIMNMEEIDGALVGGASLVPEEFIQIVNF